MVVYATPSKRNNDMKKICFIGHRKILSLLLKKELKCLVENKIQSGFDFFTMGCHGDFDRMALSVCRELKQKYDFIKIEVVLTSLHIFDKKNIQYKGYNPYSDVDTILYDTENSYFKTIIIDSNKEMIDRCDELICFVDCTKVKSGAKIALKYAQKKNLKITNLFSKEFLEE